MTYDDLLEESNEKDVIVDEQYDFSDPSYQGLYINGNIALSRRLRTYAERTGVLAEELGHHETSYGDITDQNDAGNRKQELRARQWGFDHLIGLDGLIRAYEARMIGSVTDMSEFFNVTEEYIVECLVRYRDRYGVYVRHRDYMIMFEPGLAIMKMC